MENAPVPHHDTPRPAVSPDHLELFTLPENRELLNRLSDGTALFLDEETGEVVLLRDEAYIDGTYERIGTVAEVWNAIREAGGLGIQGGTSA